MKRYVGQIQDQRKQRQRADDSHASSLENAPVAFLPVCQQEGSGNHKEERHIDACDHRRKHIDPALKS